MSTDNIHQFYQWFQLNGGHLDTSVMGIIQFPDSEGGRGAVALADIPEGHVIFSTPRHLVLSHQTSTLPTRFGLEAWRTAGLHKGWSGLLLCTMWENALGPEGKWRGYFDILPATYSTPMTWNEEDLLELKGTDVIDKIGKDDAEKDYREKVLPAIMSRPDLFKSEDLATHYCLEMYHVMGARLLTRSFTLDRDESINENLPEDGTSSLLGTEPVAGQGEGEQGEEKETDGGSSHDEDEEDDTVVALVPMADMLNARYGSENVKLFYEPDRLDMISTKPIKTGEQIWNTYGDLPNSVLLRQFGHVEYRPLAGTNIFGNPGDVVEIRADLVVQCVQNAFPELCHPNQDDAMVQDNPVLRQIDWWLEEGGDDIFVLEVDPKTSTYADPTTLEIPPLLISFIRIMLYSDEWDKAKSKGKPPKPKLDIKTLSILRDVIQLRISAYVHDMAQDEQLLLAPPPELSLNKRQALVVRVGERRILSLYSTRVQQLLNEMAAKEEGSAPPANQRSKRKADGNSEMDGGRKKKR